MKNHLWGDESVLFRVRKRFNKEFIQWCKRNAKILQSVPNKTKTIEILLLKMDCIHRLWWSGIRLLFKKTRIFQVITKSIIYFKYSPQDHNIVLNLILNGCNICLWQGILSYSSGFLINIYQYKTIKFGLHSLCQYEAQKNQVRLNFIWITLSWHINNTTVKCVVPIVFCLLLLFRIICFWKGNQNAHHQLVVLWFAWLYR